MTLILHHYFKRTECFLLTTLYGNRGMQFSANKPNTSDMSVVVKIVSPNKRYTRTTNYGVTWRLRLYGVI